MTDTVPIEGSDTVETLPEDATTPWWVRPVALFAAASLVYDHFVFAVRRLPAAYGGDSATEYLEHLRRIEFWAFLRDIRGGEGLRRAMRGLDAVEFPPLLVLLQYPFDRLFGPEPATAIATNLIWLAALAFGTAVSGRALGLSRAVALWSGLFVVLAPGVWGAARAYYYDVPMMALLSLGWGAALWAVRRGGVGGFLLAGAALACAELMKWESVLYAGAVLPALVFGAFSSDEASWRRRLLRVAGVLGALGIAAGLVRAYLTQWVQAFWLRFGQLMSLNEVTNGPGEERTALIGRLLARFTRLDFEAWTYYPQWLTSSSIGPMLVVLVLVGAVGLRRVDRRLWLVCALAVLGIWLAVLGVSDIREVRFVHPALPWLAVLAAAGLSGVFPRRPHVMPALAVLLATGQLLLVDRWSPEPGTVAHDGVSVPYVLQPVFGITASPLPQPPSNQIGWRAPTNQVRHDAAALRSAVEWVVQRTGGRGGRIGLHPLNRRFGRAEYAWNFWTLHRGARLGFARGRPFEDCGAEEERAGVRGAEYVVVDFDPTLLGEPPDAWCRGVECVGSGIAAEIDPCGVLPGWVEFGAGWTVSPPISYRPRADGPRRTLRVLERPR